MNGRFLFIVLLALAAPAIQAQQRPDPRPRNSMQDLERNRARAAAHNAQATEYGDRQAWLDSMASLAKLRTKLAEAWQNMGMSPEGAKFVAAAYDPNMASHIHHARIRGKSDQEIAQMMQDALKEKRYMDANQLLIDYQRQKLKLSETTASDTSR